MITSTRMLLKFLACGVLAGAITVLPGFSQAASLIYEQAPKSGGDAIGSSDSNFGQVLADDFSLSATASLTSLKWWGSYVDDGPYPDNFAVGLFSNLNSGTNLLSGVSTTLTRNAAGILDITITSVYSYFLELGTPLSLGAGTYYLAVSNEGLEWYWLDSATGNGLAWSSLTGPSGYNQNVLDNLAFEVNGVNAVPEPDILLLMSLGGVCLAGARKFHRVRPS